MPNGEPEGVREDQSGPPPLQFGPPARVPPHSTRRGRQPPDAQGPVGPPAVPSGELEGVRA
eukprot:7972650-Alexandrium_andersonii.AAC.1